MPTNSQWTDHAARCPCQGLSLSPTWGQPGTQATVLSLAGAREAGRPRRPPQDPSTRGRPPCGAALPAVAGGSCFASVQTCEEKDISGRSRRVTVLTPGRGRPRAE